MGVLDDAIREHLELKRKHGTSEGEIKRQATEALGPARREPPPRAPEDESHAGAVGPGEDTFFEGEATVFDPAADRRGGLAEPEVVAETDADERMTGAASVDEEVADEVPASEALEGAAEFDAPPAGEEGLDEEELAEEELAAELAGDEVDHDLATPAARDDDLAGDDRLDQEHPPEFVGGPAVGETPLREPLEEPAPDETSLDEPPLEEPALEEPAPEAPPPEEPPEEEPPSGESRPHGAEPPADDDVLEETPEFLQETPEHERLWFEQKPPRDFDLDR